MRLKRWMIRSTAAVMAVLFCVMLVRPAQTLDNQETQTDQPTEVPAASETIAPPEVSVPIETQMTETKPTETAAVETEPAETQCDPTEQTEERVVETVPQETRPIGTEPPETQIVETTPLETQVPETEPGQTEEAETEPILFLAEETEPAPDAGARDDDLSAVSGHGITFRLFNYSKNINKASGNSAWRPISSYFTFRNGNAEAGKDPTTYDIPNPNINQAHDQDGFTKFHATVERVLQNGYPMLDLTRNADGSARTDPGISSSVRSLAYLFSSGDHAVKSYRPVNTILQRSGSHYWYNSANHAVDYDIAANRFRLRNYVERNSTTASYGASYGDFLPFTYTGGTEIGSTEKGVSYHVMTDDTDYWFGMTMEVNFFQTKGGKLADQDMIFSFSGDDDVWVFVDDVLVLDLGGTHGTVDGSINFATGEVRQYLSWGGVNTSESARKNGSDTSFPTTIRACFDAAGRTPNGGWSPDGETFASFTEHTLKFYYLERGAAVANCKLDFRLPTLPDESLTVTKDLVADGNSDLQDFIADSLDYSFRVMKADDAGNPTDAHFITAGMTYDLLENGTKIGTGTVDEKGCFTLRAGQSAQFAQMLQKGGGATAYVVEEIMPDGLVGQYGGVEYIVSGIGGDAKAENHPAEGFTAFQSGVLSAEQTHVVTFRNRVDTEKLGVLKITKEAAAGTQIPQDAVFQVQVKLGDELLPIGTPYAVAGTTQTVQTLGILELREGETAMLIQGILSGTSYEITELNAAEGGYRPTYSGTVQPAGDIDCTANGVTGTFPLAATVHVTITNADYDFAVQIPVSKQMIDGHKTETFRFLAEQVVQVDGKWLVQETVTGAQITVTGSQPAHSFITIGYQAGTEGIFYYRVREQRGSGDYIYDRSGFYVEVTISDGAATITRIWKEGGADVSEILFVNRATTRLTITKTINGGTGEGSFSFVATVFLNDEPFLMPQPPDGASYLVDGNQVTFSLGHGDAITIRNIPMNAVVIVEELDYEGFIVTSRISGVDESDVNGGARTLAFSGAAMTIHFTNQTSYRLPDTGGTGRFPYTIGGAALCTGIGTAMLYSHYFRRKEEDASS